MPHVIVKLYSGRTEEQKKQLAEAITRDVVEITKCAEKSVSVAIEDPSGHNRVPYPLFPRLDET